MTIRNQSWQQLERIDVIFPKKALLVSVITTWFLLFSGFNFIESGYGYGEGVMISVFLLLINGVICVLFNVGNINEGYISNRIYLFSIITITVQLSIWYLLIGSFFKSLQADEKLGVYIAPFIVNSLIGYVSYLKMFYSEEWISSKKERGVFASLLPFVFVEERLSLTYKFWKKSFGKNKLEYKLDIKDFFGKDIDKTDFKYENKLEKLYDYGLNKLKNINNKHCFYINNKGFVSIVHEFKLDKSVSLNNEDMENLKLLFMSLINNNELTYTDYELKVNQIIRSKNLFLKLSEKEENITRKAKI